MRYLDGDFALKLLIGGEIHNTESAATENALNDKPPNFSRELFCRGKLLYGLAKLLCDILSGIVGHFSVSSFGFEFSVKIGTNCSILLNETLAEEVMSYLTPQTKKSQSL